jgi:exosortase A
VKGITTPIRWQGLLPWLLLLAAVLWLMRDAASSMVAVWIRSETFTHAFLVPPIALWLAWRQREALATVESRPVAWLLAPIAVVCFMALLGELAEVEAASHFALVTLVVLSVPALFGWGVARVLAFPLGFLYFAVPFGEFLVPQLMEWTADFTVLALRATGIPVYREGMDFVIPSGSWSVVSACSGVRYLIASLMVGTLFAYLNYRSLRRRLLFVGVAILVPIIANWLRAYMIVMIGHLSNNQLAVGVDHLLYGWVFFGIVIGLMFFIGARWSEPDPEPGAGQVPGVRQGAAAAPAWRRWSMVAAVGVLVAGAQAWAWRLEHPITQLPAPALRLPALAPGWAPAEQPMPWGPGYKNPAAVAERAAERDGRTVWLWVGYYRQQGDDSRLVTSTNRVVAAGDKSYSRADVARLSGAEGLPGFVGTELRRGAALSVGTVDRLRVWHVYWIGGRWTVSGPVAKLWQAWDMLRGRGDDGAVVMLITPLASDADATLAKFARAHLEAIDLELTAVRDTSTLSGIH